MTNEQKEILQKGRGLRFLLAFSMSLAVMLVWWKTNSLAWGAICFLVLHVIRFAPSACVFDDLDVVSRLEERQSEEAHGRGGVDEMCGLDSK